MKTFYRVFLHLFLLLPVCLSALMANASEVDLRVMSFNIRNGTANDGENHWNLRKAFVYDVIREHAPDVLGVQEAVRFQLDAFKEHLPEYGEVGIVSDSTRHTGQYSAILYRKDRFEVQATGDFWLSDTPEVPSKSWGNHHLRICTWVRLVDKRTTQAFYVYNTHMDDGSQPSREKGAQLIMNHIHGQARPAPFILMGDFNASEDNPAITYLQGAGDVRPQTPVRAIDTFRALHPSEKNVGTYNGFKGRTNGAKIDYVFVSPAFRTLESGIVRTSRDGRYPSDHFPVTARVQFERKADSTLKVADSNCVVEIEPDGFRFRITDKMGGVFASAHQACGLKLNGAVVTSVVPSATKNTFDVTAANGQKATVAVALKNGTVALTVTSTSSGSQQVELSLGGLPVAYGLGDAGGWSSRVNLVTDKNVRYSLTNNGGPQRWQSSFVICPEKQLAGVVFGGDRTSVVLGPDAYTMSVDVAGPVTFHYLTGEMPSIYANYKTLLTDNGFPWIKPKSRLFELGWESWAALGYQTNADTFLRSVKQFQDNGYPIRWAVTGSGFWEEGGTTTSFGQFGKKFPDPAALKQELHARDVKWMIGLRTNFVLPGGPHIPESKKRDFNLKVKTFNGNPLSTVGVEKDYFLKDSAGNLVVKTSPWFPIVPCYLLDGRKPDAVDWYAELYRSWGLDGIKEDTMMNIGAGPLGIFNAPISRLADEGALVMARCGSFSSPGTLLRINDTHVKDMAQRTPINYLQYAACGAPNVYSDTVGFRQMKTYSDKVVRHAWLMALTAGLAVGESPFAWEPKKQALFKRPFNFHYQFGPYLFDAAMKSYQSGFPYTMTPMGIAYPDDNYAGDPEHYQWMAGESLLCAPLVKNYESSRMDIYLPAGIWIDYDSGKKYQGPQLLKNFAMPVSKTPCFVGGKGVLVTRSADDAPLRAHVYPVGQKDGSFTFNHPDGKSSSRLHLSTGAKSEVRNAETGEPVAFKTDAASGAVSFDVKAGQSYRVVLEPSRAVAQPVNVAEGKKATACSVYKNYFPQHAVDGVVSDRSRWLSVESDQPKWLELDLAGTYEISEAVVFTGYEREDPLANFSLQYKQNGSWVDIPGAVVRGNTKQEVSVPFTAPVQTDAIRFYSTAHRVRLRELILR